MSDTPYADRFVAFQKALDEVVAASAAVQTGRAERLHKAKVNALKLFNDELTTVQAMVEGKKNFGDLHISVLRSELLRADPADTALADRIAREIELVDMVYNIIDDGDVANAVEAIMPMFDDNNGSRFKVDGIWYCTRFKISILEGAYVYLPDHRYFEVTGVDDGDFKLTQLVPPYTIKPSLELHIARLYK